MPINYDVEYPKLQSKCQLLKNRDAQNVRMIDQFREDNNRAEYIRKQQVKLIQDHEAYIKQLKADNVEMASFIDALPQRNAKTYLFDFHTLGGKTYGLHFECDTEAEAKAAAFNISCCMTHTGLIKVLGELVSSIPIEEVADECLNK